MNVGDIVWLIGSWDGRGMFHYQPVEILEQEGWLKEEGMLSMGDPEVGYKYFIRPEGGDIPIFKTEMEARNAAILAAAGFLAEQVRHFQERLAKAPEESRSFFEGEIKRFEGYKAEANHITLLRAELKAKMDGINFRIEVGMKEDCYDTKSEPSSE